MTALNGCAVRLNLNSLDDPGFDNPGDLITVLLKAAVLLRIQFGEFLERYEMTEGKYSILVALNQAGSVGLSQSAVADELMQSESNISSLIVRLQHDGFVDRRWSNTDRRKRVLLLTQAGQDLVDQIETARRDWAGEVLSKVSSKDRCTLVSLLSRLPARREIAPSRQARNRPEIRVQMSRDNEEPWSNKADPVDGNPPSPQFALKRMLSTLGLAGRFSEDES